MIASTVTRPWVLAAILQARGYPVADLAPADATAALDELLTAGVISVSFGPTQSARIAEPPPHWERAQPVLDQAWDEMIAIASLVGQVTINLRLDAAGRRLLDALPSISTLPTGERLRLHPDLDIVEESPARAAPGDRPGEYPTDAGFFGDAGAEPPEPPEPPEPCEAEAESPKADERRLQARVQDALGVTLTAGFLAGQKQLVSVRIAAEVAAGATPAEVPFPTPTPGRAVTLDVVLELRVDTDEVVRRLSGRRTCKKCGHVWHVEFDAPKVADVCDLCEGDLFQRDDDRADTVRRRLEVYASQTAPLVEFYGGEGKLAGIDALGAVEDVTERAIGALTPFA